MIFRTRGFEPFRTKIEDSFLTRLMGNRYDTRLIKRVTEPMIYSTKFSRYQDCWSRGEFLSRRTQPSEGNVRDKFYKQREIIKIQPKILSESTSRPSLFQVFFISFPFSFWSFHSFLLNSRCFSLPLSRQFLSFSLERREHRTFILRH